MANMASVSYAIEGSEKSLVEILGAICLAIHSDKPHWEEYQTCINLGFTEEKIEDKRLGGEISDEPTLENGVLRFYAEERWGLQDFAELLKKKFSDIKVYWIVEESGCEIYCTNDKEGKYFSVRYWVDTAIDDIYNSEYFETEEQVYKWLDKLTYGKVKSKEDVDKFNAEHEDSGTDDENYIYVHEFEVDE